MESVLRSLKKEEPEIAEEIGKNFSRWSTNHSAVYIKKDPQRPDLEGQLKVFKFRNQIDQLIDQMVNPEEVDGMSLSRKINPFHITFSIFFIMMTTITITNNSSIFKI
jgi:hypothetical protein